MSATYRVVEEMHKDCRSEAEAVADSSTRHTDDHMAAEERVLEPWTWECDRQVRLEAQGSRLRRWRSEDLCTVLHVQPFVRNRSRSLCSANSPGVESSRCRTSSLRPTVMQSEK